MKIIFFGTPQFSAEFLQGLISDSSFEVVGVVCQPDEPTGRKKILTPPPTKVIAEAQHIPVFQPTKLKDEAFQSELKALGADVFVVVAYGRIIPQIVLDIPRLGCVNVHPSLLPKYRGPSPIQSAIAAGETETGITIMKLDAGMDTGPILAQKKIVIGTTVSNGTGVSSEQLFAHVVTVGVPLLADTLKKYASGEVAPVAQNDAMATVCKLLTREDGQIDWGEPADVIERKIRAYTPWPGTSAMWRRGEEPVTLKIFTAKVTSTSLAPGAVDIVDNQLLVGTGTTALRILELQPSAGKRMTADAFLRGYADIANTTLK